MHRVIKLATILGLGLTVELATIAQALAQTMLPAAPLPGPYQVIIAPPRASQLLMQQPPQTIRPNWAQNAAQALPYWMQTNPAMNNNANMQPVPQPAPQQRLQQRQQGTLQVGQTGQSNLGARTQAGVGMGGASGSNMRATPGYFPGYITAPNSANRAPNARSQLSNQPQYRPQNAPFWQGNTSRNNPANMQRNGPYYGQIPQPPWGGFNPGFNPGYGPTYGPNYGPPNGYGTPPRNGAYAQPPRR